MAVLQELMRVKMLRHTSEAKQDGTVRGGSCPKKLLDRLVKELEPKYPGREINFVQRFGNWCI